MSVTTTNMQSRRAAGIFKIAFLSYKNPGIGDIEEFSCFFFLFLHVSVLSKVIKQTKKFLELVLAEYSDLDRGSTHTLADSERKYALPRQSQFVDPSFYTDLLSTVAQ